VGPRADLDAVARRKIFLPYPCRESKSGRLAHSLDTELQRHLSLQIINVTFCEQLITCMYVYVNYKCYN